MRFKDIKDDILGKDYVLSIAFVDEQTSRKLNKKYRSKDKATNVLSFALSDKLGELVLCNEVIKKEAREKKFGRNFRDLSRFLVIHGMLHLKGMKHGGTMEKAEAKYDKKYRSRNRSRVRDDAGSRRRVRNGRKKS